MSSTTPTLAQVIRKAIDARLADLRVALPGRVESFDPATQLARVQPLLRESFERVDGTEGTERLPIVSDVPVQFPGGGGYVVTFPVAAGDPCWLVFADRALDRWLSSGAEVDPVDVRRHHLSDAVAILGVRSRAGALAEFEAAGGRFGAVGGPGVNVRDGEVHLGAAAGEVPTDFVALASKVEAQLSALADAITGTPALPNDGGATIKTAVGLLQTAGWPHSTASSNVRSK